MEPRNFTSNSPNPYSDGYASRSHDDIQDTSRFRHADVPILDIDFSDDYASEPDGVNDFIRHMGAEELDQL